MSDGGAQAYIFGPFHDSSGNLLTSVKIYHYAAGTTNNKAAWSDEDKATPLASPWVPSSANGAFLAYFDGDYKIRVDDSNDVTLYTWDNFKITSDTATMWEGNFGLTYPAASASNRWHMFAKVDGSNNFRELGFNEGSAFRTILKRNTASGINVKDPPYNAVGDGVTDDTTAIQNALNDSYTTKVPVYFPQGTYLVNTLTYHGQSMYGDPGAVPFQDAPSVIQGTAGNDVFQFPECNATAKDYLDGTVVKNLKIIVDDSTDASGSFSRNGVGNAGFALQNSDGDDTAYSYGSIQLNGGGFYNVIIRSSSGSISPSNKCCGIYAQANCYNFVFQQVYITRLSYGYWEDKPASNEALVEYAPDANQFINVLIGQCTDPFQSYNSVHSVINGLQIYASTSGQKSIKILQYTSKSRAITALWTVNNLYTEENDATTGTLIQIQGRMHSFIGSTLKQSYGDAVIDWDADSCTVISCQINGATSTSAILQIDGSRNKFLQISTKSTTNDWIDNNGNGNHVEVVSFDSLPEVLSKPVVQTISRVLPAQNRTIDFILNNASLPFYNVDDLWLWPSGISWTGQTPTITKDATLESGEYVTLLSPGGGFFSITENETMVIGGRIPASRVRIYIKAQMASSGTNQSWSVTVNAVSKGAKVLAFTTSYSVQSFDADFTGTTAGHTVQIAGSNPTANQAVNIAWVAIVPFANRTLTEGLELYELSTDPSDPPEGHSVIWQSNGTGAGDDGDIMIKITAGGSTKTGTLIDFSAI